MAADYPTDTRSQYAKDIDAARAEGYEAGKRKGRIDGLNEAVKVAEGEKLVDHTGEAGDIGYDAACDQIAKAIQDCIEEE